MARMFVNNATVSVDWSANYDVVCSMRYQACPSIKGRVNIMKGYMESGEFSRGKGEYPRRTAVSC